MPVDIHLENQLGWGKNRTKNDPCKVIVFTDRRTKRILFQYAPKYIDLPILLNAMAELIAYENQKILALKKKLFKKPCPTAQSSKKTVKKLIKKPIRNLKWKTEEYDCEDKLKDCYYE